MLQKSETSFESKCHCKLNYNLFRTMRICKSYVAVDVGISCYLLDKHKIFKIILNTVKDLMLTRITFKTSKVDNDAAVAAAAELKLMLLLLLQLLMMMMLITFRYFHKYRLLSKYLKQMILLLLLLQHIFLPSSNFLVE